MEVTDTSIYKVEICGVSTSKLPLLGNEEKKILFRCIQNGDQEAQEQYVKGNLGLVLSVIQRFSDSNEDVDDLFQIGCIDLIKAIDNFGITRNVYFSTYAVPMILGEVRRYLRDSSSIRVNRSLWDIVYKAICIKEALTRKNLRDPSIMEITDETDISKEEITYALGAIQTPVSLFEPVFTDGDDSLYVMDQIDDKRNLEESWMEDLSLSRVMKRFPEWERRITDMRFFGGKTWTEVAEEVDISRARVSRLEESVLKSMRNYLS